jgi:hypothetical protein
LCCGLPAAVHGSAQAGKFVVSGQPLLLYQVYAAIPDCSSVGPIVVRVSKAPEHGRVSIRSSAVFPRFPEANPRSVCNRRRVPGMQANYVSQRGYTGFDLVELEVFFPAGRAFRVHVPIRLM